MADLEGKKILILTGDLFLHKKVFDYLKDSGALVDVLENKLRHNLRTSGLDIRGLLFFIPTILNNNKYLKQYLRFVYHKSYDLFITFNNCESALPLIGVLKKNNPKIKTIIYFEDSFCTWDYSYQIKYFDRCFTFDKKDADKYSIKYLPWFIIDDIKDRNKKTYKYDICFIGSTNQYYPYRLPVLNYLYNKALKNGANPFIKCFSSIFRTPVKSKLILLLSCYKKSIRILFHQIHKYKKSGILINKKIPFSMIKEIEADSKCIVDINMERQGISPRIISALANGKKVIINNKYIKEEPFYSPCNIWVIDNKNPYFDFGFLEKKCDVLDMDAYKIGNWVTSLLNMK